jgi:hypothetical protein
MNRSNERIQLLAMYYKGALHITAAVANALSGAPDAKTTDYGDSCEFSAPLLDLSC